jgi:MinD-like ATPase involved in chromosome partitioning or flagellar assembly
LIISIFSPKGGVGKTTITLALADVLSKDRKVCVVEYDFSPGDFASYLNVGFNKNIVHAIDGYDAIQKVPGKNFDVIVGGIPSDYDKISVEKLKILLQKLNDIYDIVLFDIQPGFIESCIDIMNNSDKVLLIIEDDLRIAARVNGFLDWIVINDLGDLKNYAFIKNKSMQNELVYIDKIRYKLPILHSIPYIKNLTDYNEKHIRKEMLKFAQKLRGGANESN